MIRLQHYLGSCPNQPKKCLPFYKILNKDKPFRWSEDYEDVFAKLKEYLSALLILTKAKERETLFLYIIAFDQAVKTVLIVEQDDKERPIYFTSKVLHGTKVRYQKIKKLAYTMVLASR